MRAKARTLEDVIRILSAHKPILANKYRVRSIGVFGSYARGDTLPTSDVDILVELDEPVGWEIVDLRDYLEEILGIKVDLVTKGAVTRKPLLWQDIQKDLIHV
ncbi:MAG: nucleotidyltransferase family protein [Anaerolineae bacterium]